MPTWTNASYTHTRARAQRTNTHYLTDAGALPEDLHADAGKGELAELLDRVSLTSGNHEILRLVLLQHKPPAARAHIKRGHIVVKTKKILGWS